MHWRRSQGRAEEAFFAPVVGVAGACCLVVGLRLKGPHAVLAERRYLAPRLENDLIHLHVVSPRTNARARQEQNEIRTT